MEELILSASIEEDDILYPNPNLKVLACGAFNLKKFKKFVKMYPNLEKLTLNNESRTDAQDIDPIRWFTRLLKELKRLKLFACHNPGLWTTFCLSDAINMLKDAKNLEYFLLDADIDDFDEIYKHFASKFDVVRYTRKYYHDHYLLMSQRKILKYENEKTNEFIDKK